MREYKCYSELNRIFEEKLKNVDLFEGELFNYVKVVQLGLYYHQNEWGFKKIRNYFHLPYFLVVILMKLKNVIRRPGKVSSISCSENLVWDDKRSILDINENKVSPFFSNIIGGMGRGNCTVFKATSKDLDDFDVDVCEYLQGCQEFGVAERKVLKDALAVNRKLSKSGCFSQEELEFIRSSFHLFLDSFLNYNAVVKNTSGIKRCFIVCHYYAEGLIAALKLKGIEVIELQHGLVAKNDVFYVYPEYIGQVKKEHLFPDKMLVFGEHWKSILSHGFEFKSSAVKVVGNYIVKSSREVGANELPKENILLICSQKLMPQYFVPYCEKVVQLVQTKYPDWKVVIKLHPGEESPEKYSVFDGLNNVVLAGVDSDLYYWLQKAKIQVSFYSTTFYDAIRYGVVNFSVQDACPQVKYCEDMVVDRAAYKLLQDEDPVEKFLNLGETQPLLKWEEVYSEFEPSSLKAMVD